MDITPEQSELIEELRTLTETTISEWKEWESAAESVIRVLDDVEGALDAEDFAGAVEDALGNVRSLDWSMPKRMDDLTGVDMVRIENILDELHTEFESRDAEEDDDGETDEEYRARIALEGNHSPESYLRGAIDAIRAENLDDATKHIVEALRRLPR